MVLYAAVEQHGSPEAIVSDSGSSFRAKQTLDDLRGLGHDAAFYRTPPTLKNYIETAFNVQWRIADWHVRQITT
ncbi:MAG: hypothetical protein NVSMB42_06650 [Herpetosiphon sp.]